MYINGMVCAVPTANREAYVALAQNWAAFCKESGALQVMDCWGEDVPEGKLTSFPMAVQRKDDETVVFSWVTWPDKATSTKAMTAAMKDPRFSPANSPMDGKRMIHGGFVPL